jgi:hypothetical protein
VDVTLSDTSQRFVVATRFSILWNVRLIKSQEKRSSAQNNVSCILTLHRLLLSTHENGKEDRFSREAIVRSWPCFVQKLLEVDAQL